MVKKIIITALISFLFIGVVFNSGCTEITNGNDSNGGDSGNDVNECNSDEDCDDGDERTRDRCLDGECVYAIAPAASSPI